MIRHSSSFFISLILHFALVFIVFSVYKIIMDNKATTKIQEDKKVKIMLCSLPSPKPIIQKTPTQEPAKTFPTKKQIKKQEPVIKKEVKILPKVKSKPVPKLKPIPIEKKIEPPVKKVDLKPKNEVVKAVQEVQVKQKNEIIQAVQENKQEVEKIQKNEEEPRESSQEKENRLSQEYIDENIKKIFKLLSENLYYPRSARKRNIQDNVMVKFKLSTSAEVYGIEVTSSKSEILSRAAIRTIENLSGKFPSPPEELILHVPITYKLN